VPPKRTHGPLPHESSFVQGAGDSIPDARVRITTASSRGNLRGRGKGRKTSAHVPDNGHAASRGRGTRKRVSDASTSNNANKGRGRARTPATNNTGIAPDHHGEGEEMPLTQNAPDPDVV
jgi:hypothetical protein